MKSNFRMSLKYAAAPRSGNSSLSKSPSATQEFTLRTSIPRNPQQESASTIGSHRYSMILFVYWAFCMHPSGIGALPLSVQSRQPQ